jgi:hypothetical protein
MTNRSHAATAACSVLSTVCLAVCPFSQVGYDAVKTRFKGNLTAPKFQIPTTT